MALRVERPTDVDAFLALAGSFLGAREAEHNLQLGICSWIRAAPENFTEAPRFQVVLDETDAVAAAGLRTPPFNEVVSQADDPAAVDALADALVGEPLPGVLIPRQHGERFVARWTQGSGRSGRLEMSERIFRLDHVIPPHRPASGEWRMAEPRDRELIAGWVLSFHAEAMPEQPPIEDALQVADRWIAGIYRRLYLWEDGGRPVSVVGAGGETPNGIRIGPVYTPPEERRHGYATSLTAAASADQLARGRRFCFLFTDLANPTSNAIYQSIGYRPVCDVDQYRFEGGG